MTTKEYIDQIDTKTIDGIKSTIDSILEPSLKFDRIKAYIELRNQKKDDCFKSDASGDVFCL